MSPSRLLKKSSEPASPSVVSHASGRELKEGSQFLSQGAETLFIRKWVFPHPTRPGAKEGRGVKSSHLVRTAPVSLPRKSRPSQIHSALSLSLLPPFWSLLSTGSEKPADGVGDRRRDDTDCHAL